ncbi:MAG: hypothetical protein L0H84_09310 [Pseudonocardia sp.]|nr:hypothetical protein [Pseudonocardia sp.]
MTARAIWLPGLLVAIGAAVVTAHGLFEVAAAAGVPLVIAWLYPLITDGLALVAYAATARLVGPAGRYAWTVVVLAAGLSGLAQASYLAGGVAMVAPAALRFGVGAWPAIAAAVVAHLLYLLVVEPDAPDVQTPATPARPAVRPARPTPPVIERRETDSPARDRARAAALRHADEHGDLPTVSRLMTLAAVSRGTAGDALKTLRNRPTDLHLVTTNEQQRTQP